MSEDILSATTILSQHLNKEEDAFDFEKWRLAFRDEMSKKLSTADDDMKTNKLKRMLKRKMPWENICDKILRDLEEVQISSEKPIV